MPTRQSADTLALRFYGARSSIVSSTGALPDPIARLALADSLAHLLLSAGAEPGSRRFAAELQAFTRAVTARAIEAKALTTAATEGAF